MKVIVKLYIGLSIILFQTSYVSSQDLHEIMNRLAETTNPDNSIINTTSVYLSTAKDSYVRGEDLWFHALVLDDRDLSLSLLDKTLYLQLEQKGSNTVVWREMYTIDKGLSSGQVYLADTLQEGDYLLKAYTSHSFFAHQKYFYAVVPIHIVGHPRSLAHSYIYRIRDDSVVANGSVHLSLSVEGGSLVDGFQGRVAFRVEDRTGKPVAATGKLLDGDNTILTFKTVHDGMGSFLFTPKKNKNYHIKFDNNSDSLYALPKIQGTGIVMQLVENGDDSLVFRLRSGAPAARRIFLRLQARGNVLAMATGVLQDSLTIKLPVSGCIQGVAEATVLDGQGRLMATRLVYLHQDRQLKIAVSGLKESYGQEEKVTLRIKTTDSEGHPVATILGLSVYDRLFGNLANSRDIGTYYNLSTQIQGRINDPSYYFDSAHRNRKEALDLLMLCMGDNRYAWNADKLKGGQSNYVQILSDSLPATLTGKRSSSAKGKKAPFSLLFFSYNKSASQMTTTDSSGNFYITPGNLSLGSRFFVRYFSEKEYGFGLPDPFGSIRVAETASNPEYILAEKNIIMDTADSPANTPSLSQYSNMLESVVVKTRSRGFSDRYLGYLDSIAQYEGNMDYVGVCGWLNCPACGTGTKPIEGRTYFELIEPKRSQVSSHPFSFNTNEMKRLTYHYPKYTEAELLKRFKMAIVKGYYKGHKFEEPDHDRRTDSMSRDERNLLTWRPSIITDNNGEATVAFFCSDIRSRFYGTVEGIGGDGLLGTVHFTFNVK